jgi:tetratricopeptide (TPR) repeat protein
MYDHQRQREKALIMWEGAIKLIPDSIQVESALWNNQREAREVAEELVEYIRAIRAFPKATKHEVFFEENK